MNYVLSSSGHNGFHPDWSIFQAILNSLYQCTFLSFPNTGKINTTWFLILKKYHRITLKKVRCSMQSSGVIAFTVSPFPFSKNKQEMELATITLSNWTTPFDGKGILNFWREDMLLIGHYNQKWNRSIRGKHLEMWRRRWNREGPEIARWFYRNVLCDQIRKK